MGDYKDLTLVTRTNLPGVIKQIIFHRYVKLPLGICFVLLLCSPIGWGWKKSFGINSILFRGFLPKKITQRKRQIKNKELKQDTLVGRNKGIQGSRNSCYLDALLFSMFYATDAFKSILDKCDTDPVIARTTREVLKDFVYQPLRSDKHFCSASDMMKLRNLLSKYNPKIMGSFQAVEDVVYLLFEKILNEDKLIQYEDNIDGYMHVILADTSSTNRVTTIQNVFERSMMLYGDLKFKFVPLPGFILSWPFDQDKLFHYAAIFPVLELDIVENITSEKCSKCENVAVWETATIRNCTQSNITSYFCSEHVKTVEAHVNCINRRKMQLTSVMCFRGSHFTSFVRDCISGNERWLYFNSMTGSSSEVKDVTEILLRYYDQLTKTSVTSGLPYEIDGFFHDAHTCIYEPVYYRRSLEIPKELNKSRRGTGILGWIANKFKSSSPKND